MHDLSLIYAAEEAFGLEDKSAPIIRIRVTPLVVFTATLAGCMALYGSYTLGAVLVRGLL